MTYSTMAKLGAGLAAAVSLAAAPGAALADITFDGLPGNNGDTFTSYTEDGLTIAALGGAVFVGKNFGNPIPDLYFGGRQVVLEITAGGELFDFDSWDFAANNGVTSWAISGFNGANETFTASGSDDTSGGGFSFVTLASGTNLAFDRLTFTFDVGGTSANFDNFVGGVDAVPEPSTWALLIAGFGLAGATLRRRRLAHA